MDILGIGFPELVFIFIIAMMVFGPRRLPEMAAKAGKLVRDLRNMSQGFMLEWEREITVAARLEEIEQARQEIEKAQQEFRQAQQKITSDILPSSPREDTDTLSLPPTLPVPPSVGSGE